MAGKNTNRNGEYTHGGSAGKNMKLLSRALADIAAFAATWVGLWMLCSGKGNRIGLPLTLVGAVVLGICLWTNLIVPMARKNRHQ